MRISGLATGIDTQDLVARLMAIERRPIVLIKDRQEQLALRRREWLAVRDILSDLQAAVSALSGPSSLKGMVASSSDKTAVSVAAGAGADPGTYRVVVDSLATAHRVASDQQLSISEPLGLSGTFSLQGEDVVVSEDMSLGDIRDRINEAGAGVVATAVDLRLVLTRAETGAEPIAVSDDDGVLEALGVLAGGGFKHELVGPQDATFTVDGLSITRSSNVINDVIHGVTLTLARAGPDEITVAVDKDVTSALNKLVTFVDNYNRAMSSVRTRSGLDGRLQGDSALQRLAARMRQIVGSEVPGIDLNRLDLIGVTGSLDGTLTVDQDKFRSVFVQDPDSVSVLLTDSEHGIAVQLQQFVAESVASGGLISQRTTALQSRIDGMTARIDALEHRLTLREEGLIRRFNELEVAMSTLQNQSAWLDMQIAQWMPARGQ